MRILLVDGTNVVMRYAHAMAGNEVGALPNHPLIVREVPSIMRAVEVAIRECAAVAQCTHAIVALDSGIESRRKALYPEYKGKRLQSTTIWGNRLAIYCHEHQILTQRWSGEEADDVIATLVARVGRAGSTCAVLSGDSDMLQLASLWCDVFQFGQKGEPRYVCRSMAWIAEKYGLKHSGQLPLYKALVGDPSDNLPGVKGIGKKKAQVLLRTFETAEALRACSMVPPEQFALMLSLVTLNEQVPLDPITPTMCRLSGRV